MDRKSVVAVAVLVLPLALDGRVDTRRSRGAALRCGGHRATIVGTAGRDEIHGTKGRDVIAARGGTDVVYGGGGNDLICGGDGQDALVGGFGNDRIFGNGSRWDSLAGGRGDDRLVDFTAYYFDPGRGDDTMVSNSRTTLSYATSRGVSVDLAAGKATGWGADTFDFGRGRATLVGSAYDDTLLGSPRRDTIWGQGGEDSIDGREGADHLFAAGGSVAGGIGDDVLAKDDSYRTGAFPDLDGGAGNDRLSIDFFGQGPPLPAGVLLDGGGGTDSLSVYGKSDAAYAVTYDMGSGSLSVDSAWVTAANLESFFGYIDEESPFETTFDVIGTDGRNEISVFGTDSTIHALGGDDVIQSGNGDDLIDGGPGDDTADGRDGTDTCASVEHPSNCEVSNP